MDHRFVIGVDPHPNTHTACVVDANGKLVDTLRVKNTEEGFQELRGWADGFEGRVWAIEGASNPFVCCWVKELLQAGEEVVNIAPSLTSQYRARHSRKKNDSVDAHNAARALLANPLLPPYTPPPEQRRLQVLSRTRRRLAVQLKANRMALKDMPEEFLEEREVLKEIVHCLCEKLKRLEALMGQILNTSAPEILKIQGVGPVLGATIVAEVGEVSRLPAWANSSATAEEDRALRRQEQQSLRQQWQPAVNYVVHMIAQVRLRIDERSRALVER